MSGVSSGSRQREITDNDGTTTAITGTATTTPAGFPTTPGQGISQVLIKPLGNFFEASFDGGSTYLSIVRNSVLTWDVKGEPTQIFVRTTSGTSDFEMLVNREAAP